MKACISSILVVLLLVAAPAYGDELAVGKTGAFELPKAGGERVTLAGLLAKDATKIVVVDVTSYTCPYALRADADLPPILESYGAKGVVFVGVYPNEHETADGIAAYAKKSGFTHLLLHDATGAVAKSWGAEVTPTFFVFDKGSVLRYRGNPKGLAPALDAVLAGETVETPRTPATGCTIKWPGEPAAPTPPPARPDGPRLSEGAQAWLGRLIAHLGSSDPAVRRSAAAGIEALGPAAVPHLERARKGAEGSLAGDLDRLIGRLREGPRPGPAGERPPAPAGGPRRFGLDYTRQLLVERLELTAEQKTRLDSAFEPLLERERALRQKIEGGDREGAREDYRALRDDVRKAIDSVLTEEQKAKYEELRRAMRGGGRRGRGE